MLIISKQIMNAIEGNRNTATILAFRKIDLNPKCASLRTCKNGIVLCFNFDTLL